MSIYGIWSVAMAPFPGQRPAEHASRQRRGAYKPRMHNITWSGFATRACLLFRWIDEGSTGLCFEICALPVIILRSAR